MIISDAFCRSLFTIFSSYIFRLLYGALVDDDCEAAECCICLISFADNRWWIRLLTTDIQFHLLTTETVVCYWASSVREEVTECKFRPFLGAVGVKDAKRFVAFVLEASGRLGPDAGAFLDYLRTLCRFPILRFRALKSVISVKHNAQMALRWVRYFRRPI